MRNIVLKLNPDNKAIGFSGNKLCIKISSKPNNGLSFITGILTATKAPDGSGSSGGTMNTPGNGIGPISSTPSTTLDILGMNSSVSRHKKYTGGNTFIRENDGPVMTKLNNGSLVSNGSIASYMISYAGG